MNAYILDIVYTSIQIIKNMYLINLLLEITLAPTSHPYSNGAVSNLLFWTASKIHSCWGAQLAGHWIKKGRAWRQHQPTSIIFFFPTILNLYIMKIKFYVHLEPQTTIYKWMFGETTIFYVKISNHPIETSIYKWLFGVPGIYIYIVIWRKTRWHSRNWTLSQFFFEIEHSPKWFGWFSVY